MRASVFFLAIAGPAAMSGCDGGDPSRPPPTVSTVDGIHLTASPTALNWDADPRPDGIGVRVYFSRGSDPAPVLIDGALDFELHAGSDPGDGEPLRRWTFTSEQLAGLRARDTFGWHYAIPLDWGSHVPRAANVTLVGIGRPTAGRPVRSRPTTISVSR